MASDGNRTFTEKLVWHFTPADWKRGSLQRRRKVANILSGEVQRGKEGYTWSWVWWRKSNVRRVAGRPRGAMASQSARPLSALMVWSRNFGSTRFRGLVRGVSNIASRVYPTCAHLMPISGRPEIGVA